MAPKYLDENGLAYFWSKIKDYFATTAFYKKLESYYTTSTVPISTIPINIAGFNSADMLFVDINGLDLVLDKDYSISGTNIVLTTPISTSGQIVHFCAFKVMVASASDYSALKGDPGDVSEVLLNGNSIVGSDGTARITSSALIDIFYPVGSYYETSNANFNPNTAWGGTWIKEIQGMVHVSGGSSYPVSKANNASGAGEKDGGSSTVTLQVTQIPAHNHRICEEYGATANPSYGPNNTYAQIAGPNAGTHSWQSYPIENTGGGQAHENMQPYINVYRWHRTA